MSNTLYDLLNANEVISIYKSGLSLTATARKLNVSRTPIKKILDKHNIIMRSFGDSMRLVAESKTPEQRSMQALNAREAIRNAPKQFFEARNRNLAISKQKNLSMVGALEQVFYDKLIAMGHDCSLQTAVDGYNIDITCGKVALEIHNHCSNPHISRDNKYKIAKLNSLGWHVIYVKVFRIPIPSPLIFTNISLHFKELNCGNFSPTYILYDALGKRII